MELLSQIERWMRTTIASRRDLDFADLHLDEIDASYRSPESWISGAVTCLESALLLRNANQWPFVVAVGFSLTSNSVPSGLEIKTLGDLLPQLDMSPPSLYLFGQGSEPWQHDPQFRPWAGLLVIPTNLRVKAYFREWFDSNDEDYRRSFWLCG
jgi:hypothetical protein